jgi:endonuclease/exonuclease/phosphatase family metal-dependent hydrolase
VSAEGRLKLVTLNAWGRSGPWRRRRALIADGMRALDPHVVGLAGVCEDSAGNTARELADAIGGTWHVHYGPAAWDDDRTQGNAILSRFPLEDAEAWPLPEPSGDHGRSLVFARAATPWGKLGVFVTHLSWRFDQSAARLLQLQQVREWMKERVHDVDQHPEHLPPVLMGDFNAEPDADEIRLLRGLLADPYGCYLADCFALCGEGKGATWHRGNAYAAREPHPDRRIDYILVRGPDRRHRGEPLVARVVLDEPRDGVFASDHYGVYAEVRATPVALPPLPGD